MQVADSRREKSLHRYESASGCTVAANSGLVAGAATGFELSSSASSDPEAERKAREQYEVLKNSKNPDGSPTIIAQLIETIEQSPYKVTIKMDLDKVIPTAERETSPGPANVTIVYNPNADPYGKKSYKYATGVYLEPISALAHELTHAAGYVTSSNPPSEEYAVKVENLIRYILDPTGEKLPLRPYYNKPGDVDDPYWYVDRYKLQEELQKIGNNEPVTTPAH